LAWNFNVCFPLLIAECKRNYDQVYALTYYQSYQDRNEDGYGDLMKAQ
jgi:hypothetical protein